MQVTGIGRVVFWEGGSLWLGLVTGVSELHSHHAIQIGLPLEGDVQFQGAEGGEWTTYPGVVITPDWPHAFQAPGKVVATILFEPESAEGRAVLARYSAQGVSELPAADVALLAAPIAEAYFSDASDATLVAVAREAIARLAGIDRPSVPTDQRVLGAIAFIREHIDEPIPLRALALRAGLSPGRFRHLFVAETGVSCKAFVLWERLNKALALGYSGMSWTEAAHAANFADSAHLSRTCRRMFGLAPTSARVARPEAVQRLIA